MKSNIIYKLQPQDSYLTQQDKTFQGYKDSVELAEDVHYPNRTSLIELYNWITAEDTHLRTVLKQRTSRVLSQPFILTNKKGNVVSTVMDSFEQEWFYKFLKDALYAKFFGNSLIEINYYDNHIQPTLIDRRYCIPEKKMIKRNPYNFEGDIDYSAPLYSKKLIDLNNNGDSKDLGELRGVTLHSLAKLEGVYSYAKYVNLFGIPLRVGTTDSEDLEEIERIKKFLNDMGSGGYMVKNSATELELMQSSGSNNTVHRDYIDFLNKEISKAFLGQTMTTENGGSYSQSKVHQSESYNITNDDIKFLEKAVNSQLIPILKRLGIIKSDYLVFKMDRPDVELLEHKIQRDQFIINNFEVDKKYFENRYGITIKSIKNENRSK